MKLLLSAAFLVLTATPAMAQPQASSTSVVRLADLDLGSNAGKRALDRRISLAVAEVCGTASDADLVGQNQVRDCRIATRARVGNIVETRMANAAKGQILLAAR